MKVNILELLRECGLSEKLYPGKKSVRKLPQPGEFKSHCVAYDWRDPDIVRIEVKAGLSGQDMKAKDLARYPVHFQAPTFIDIDVHEMAAADESAGEEEGEGEAQGEAGGGRGGSGDSRGMKKKKLSNLSAFSNVSEGRIPGAGDIVRMVVMGKEIAKEAFGAVLETLKAQIQHAKIAPTDLLAKAGNFITKYTPPAFLAPRGDEDKTYKYDREKNADIGITPRLV
jgi:hypothetical protein